MLLDAGGTINALVEVAEELTLRSTGKRQPIDFGVLNRSKVCIIHSGGDSQRSPTQSVCGKAWSSLNLPARPSAPPELEAKGLMYLLLGGYV